MTISIQLCQCGCGRETNLDQRGEPRRYLRGHNKRGSGKGWIDQGRWFISVDGKAKALHRYLMEAVLGRELSSHEIVHHADHDPMNNDPENLVLLSRSEHMRVHALAGRPERWTEEEKNRLLLLRQAGMTLQECSTVLERSYSGTQAQAAKFRKEAQSAPTAWEDAIPRAA
jgi:hypothetical protein